MLPVRAWRRAAAPVAVALTLVLLAGCGSGEVHADDALHGNTAAHPLRKPAFTLTDTEGRPFDFVDETKGQLTLLYFGYTNCPDVCRIDMNELAAVEARPGVPRAKVVFVTVDPARDTKSVLREWLDHYDPRFIGLTGTAAQIAKAEEAAGLPFVSKQKTASPDTYLMSHTGVVRAYAPDGRLYATYPFGTKPSVYEHDLKILAKRT
jgi:protein SCO1/2